MCCDNLKKILINVKDSCISNSTVAEENGKKITFSKYSANELCKLKLDDCHYDNSVKKCDYLFYICKSNEIHLVELKGTDVEYGCTQILETQKQIQKEVIKKDIDTKSDNPNITYKGHIVSSSVPKSTEMKFRKLQEKALKENKILIKKYHHLCKI